jgi:hypothetical protein
MRPVTPVRTRTAWAIVLTLAATANAVARDKLDIVQVRNGDRITCEIVDLKGGRLQAKTSSFGTVYIDWKDVLSIESPHTFSFEMVDGDRRTGRLEPSGTGGWTRLVDADRPAELALADIARLGQEEMSFGGRIRGSASLGFDHVHATDTTVFNFGLDAEYRHGPKITDLSIDLSATESSDEGRVEAGQIALFRQWLRSRGWFTFGMTAAERNEAQGIDVRLLLGGGVGRYLRRSIDSELIVFGGLTGVEEWLAEPDEDGRTSAEVIAGLRWLIFRFGDPETTLNSRLVLFPSLTESARVRARLDTSLRREIVKDLFLDVGFYDSYESHPSGPDAPENDYGVTTSVGYKF